MNRNILTLLLIFGLFLSFALHIYRFRTNNEFIEKISRDIYVNCEISTQYADSIKIIQTLFGFGDTVLHGIPLNSELNSGDKTVRFFDGKRSEGYPFVKSLSLRVSAGSRENILKSIDNLNVFIGNKCFYFSSSDLINLPIRISGKYCILKLPNLQYSKNLLNFINFNGNDIFAVNSFLAIIKNPFDFMLIYIFLFALIFVKKRDVFIFFNKISSRNKIIIAFSVIMILGFFFRITGLSQISIWVDELYSLTRASNPALPFSAALSDPGNPPLYYILLRFWMFVFGFTEISARMFSVFLGTLAIAAAYFGLKKNSSKKTALFAALLTAFCGYLIGQSQEIRCYILEIMLVPICVSTFLKFTQNPHSAKDMFFASITGAMLVNTHYYGAVLIFVFGMYFIVKIIINKEFSLKNIKCFLIFCIIIILSFMPYFIVTSINKAVLDESFNTWIRKPGLVFSLLAAIFPLLAVSYLSVVKLLHKILSKNEIDILNFIVFVMLAGYEAIFAISLFRPILTERYLIIALPLFIAAAAVLISGLLRSEKTFALGILLGYLVFISLSNTKFSFREQPYKESLSYIEQDAKSHSYKFSVLEYIDVADYNDYLGFIGKEVFPLFDKNENYDMIYMPLKPDRKDYYNFFEEYGFSLENTLVIRINEREVLYKKRSGNLQNTDKNNE